MEGRDAQPADRGVRAKATEAQLAVGRQQNERAGRRVPLRDDVRIREPELDRRVRGLTRLGGRRQISTSDQVQPGRRCALRMRHISIVAADAGGG